MFSRKQISPPNTPLEEEKDKYYYSKYKETQFSLNNPNLKFASLVFIFLSSWLLLLLFWFPPKTTNNVAVLHLAHETQNPETINLTPAAATKSPFKVPTCDPSVAVYVYPLAPKFNTGLLSHCQTLNVYTDMCPHVANRGLGQPLPKLGSPAAWFATHQFIAEMIFHARVENHPCRTLDPARAALFYVPFYGGLHASSMFKEANLTARDELAVDLVDHLQAQPWWGRNSGRDHFIALGRTAWDFMRATDGPDFGANSLLNLPAVKNMSVLTVERHPWQGSNQHGIPYPSYFHPSTWQEMLTWQNKVREMKRPNLFSFIGGPRKGLEKAAIRNEFIRQCGESTRCLLMNCGPSGASKCHEPSEVLKVMTESTFCLQAPGDSFTRRSTFDSVLAGCIPVFFSPHTAYTQYKWFLPEEVKTYSVYIDEKSPASRKIEDELLKISGEEVKAMREKLVDLIPSLTYAHPNATDVGFGDAVDVALASLANHVSKMIN
ncbi:putative xyloglucan galactosyltransferase GT17 [Prunus yedoensis var. nudiflora]|uniref:Putative xyloglucan galactosyltransferase GT17 n=1 Tax=Prunus yedoensis var. nudiflora TaxID=2094558 RepID=A0A314YFV1_PRUYE|nr:putative xyloglucan galactosyltransferase GT17 [Prunus yedoensis var. nudiflora]